MFRRFGFPLFESCGPCTLSRDLSFTINETLEWLSSLPVKLMQTSSLVVTVYCVYSLLSLPGILVSASTASEAIGVKQV